jgi:hypothetical protein
LLRWKAGEGESVDPEPSGSLRPAEGCGGARQQNGPYRLGRDDEGRTVSADRQRLTPAAIRKLLARPDGAEALLTEFARLLDERNGDRDAIVRRIEGATH